MNAILLTAAAVLLTSAAQAQSPRRAMQTPACAANQLSLTFDTEGGQFDGMSHSGALLVLRNIGEQACTVPLKPRLTFLDQQKKSLNISFQVPVGMHPGPVQIPVVVPGGAEATGTMRWVSGEVFDHSTCLTPAYASLQLGTQTLQVAFGYHLCGQTGQPLTYEQQPLHRDPPLKP